ncbi:hypothetical protein P8C59_001184 [Phyllachora maydis]|uniref:Uncharacterized protein n=1 Tax=Phyllachora maydis TaxID=1825666 RepID=A0AAD9HXP3_9PEZI|nr:hypothetical protein P8C59_001184 [Phyllachora maydis]
MADQAKGKGIAPKRASNPANPGQSSRPPLPIQTLSEDKEDSKDYSKVIEVLKQHKKSHKRVIASQSTTAIATTTAAATATTTTSATDSTTAITATRPGDISFDSPFKGLSNSQYATTANAATAPLKKGKEKEKALSLSTLALTFLSLIDSIVSLSINNPAFKEIVEYIGLARKLGLTQILKEEEKKAVIPIFPSFTSQAQKQKKQQH